MRRELNTPFCTLSFLFFISAGGIRDFSHEGRRGGGEAGSAGNSPFLAGIPRGEAGGKKRSGGDSRRGSLGVDSRAVDIIYIYTYTVTLTRTNIVRQIFLFFSYDSTLP